MTTPATPDAKGREADVFTELLDWISQIEVLTDTIRQRIATARKNNDT